MSKLYETKIVITKTVYDKESEYWSEPYRRNMVGHGEIVKIQVDGTTVFYRDLPDYLQYKRCDTDSPVDSFLDYIDMSQAPKHECNNCRVNDQIRRCRGIVSDLELSALVIERSSLYIRLKHFFMRLQNSWRNRIKHWRTHKYVVSQ